MAKNKKLKESRQDKKAAALPKAALPKKEVVSLTDKFKKAKMTIARNWSKKIKPWLINQQKAIRQIGKHRSARAVKRFGAPAGISLLALLTLAYAVWPREEFFLSKIVLLQNPHDTKASFQLAQSFLAHRQFAETETMLNLIEDQVNYPPLDQSVLGQQTSLELETIAKEKRELNPQEIREEIVFWEKIVTEKPDYRDGWLQLAFLHYKIYQDQSAEEAIEKALTLDPNHSPLQKLETIIKKED